VAFVSELERKEKLSASAQFIDCEIFNAASEIKTREAER